MTWNYRVVQDGNSYAIYEVYYDSEGNIEGRTESPTFAEGSTLNELQHDFDFMSQALRAPVITSKDFKNDTK